MATLESYVDHARLFGTECVVESARQEWKGNLVAELKGLRGRLPSPVDLTEMTQGERERVLDDREKVFASYRDKHRRALHLVAQDLRDLRGECEKLDYVPPKLSLRERRVARAVELHQQGKTVKEIAFQMQRSRQTVLRYLADLPKPMEESGPNMHSTARFAKKTTDTLAPSENGVRARKLAERIVALHESGLVVAAIADRLGKSDATVRRYLRQVAA